MSCLLGGLFGVLLASACSAPGGAGKGAADAGAAVARATPEELPTANQPLFRALAGAVEEDERELARHLIARLSARPLTTREVEVVEAFERILAGRGLVDALAFELESRYREEAGDFRLLLHLTQSTDRPLVLRLPPADLEHLRVAVDPQGLEAHEFGTRAVDRLGDLELLPGQRLTVELATYRIPLGRAVAVRDHWRLAPRSGEILRGDEVFPARGLPAPKTEEVVLSSRFADRDVVPEDLVRLLAEEEPDGSRALALAVSIPAERRDETLDALEPAIQELAREDPERFAAFAPALRWLGRTGDPGALSRDWSRWFEERAVRRTGSAERAAPRLELPDEPRAPHGPRGPGSSGVEIDLP